MQLFPEPNATARLAYEIWEHEGRPHGRDRQHWQEAEHLLTMRPVSVSVVPKPALKSAPRMLVGRRTAAPVKILAR